MGRRRLMMKKIDNPTSRHITFSKRKDGLVKKATELSVLCGIDVGLLMFSPNGRPTTYANKGSIEDIFLHFVEQPNELTGRPVDNVEYLYRSLKHLKKERELLEKISRIEDLEQEFLQLEAAKLEKQDKLRSLNPDVRKIHTIQDSHVVQQALIDAIFQVEQLKKILLDKQKLSGEPQNNNIFEIPTAQAGAGGDDDVVMTELTVGGSNQQRKVATAFQENKKAEAAAAPNFPAGPHLTLGYLMNQKGWNLRGEGSGVRDSGDNQRP